MFCAIEMKACVLLRRRFDSPQEDFHLSEKRGLHWFRNDLRGSDNSALAEAARAATKLATLFVFDDRLLAGDTMGSARVQFLLESLTALSERLEASGQHLLLRRGDPRKVIPEEVRRLGVDFVSFNRDTSPFALARDAEVARRLEKEGVDVRSMTDRVVFSGDAVLTKTGSPYTVFTPYRNNWMDRYTRLRPRAARAARLPPPIELRPGRSKAWAKEATTRLPTVDALGYDECSADLPSRGGEKPAKARLTRFLDHSVADYETLRDRPDLDGTSRLSPHLHFGTLSVRQCLDAAQKAVDEDKRRRPGVRKWVDELVWREFYAQVLEHHPRVVRRSFRTEYDALEWDDRDEFYEAWCSGETGFPIVDAGMRQLRETGWMHNRVRMIVASFLTKDLLVDWRRGAAHFSRWLVDADTASNNGGWQWAASTGTDAQPYFRIFNPTRQGERFDPEGTYVRRFVPELESLSPKEIHQPEASPLLAPAYASPIVVHSERREEALRRYKRARGDVG